MQVVAAGVSWLLFGSVVAQVSDGAGKRRIVAAQHTR